MARFSTGTCRKAIYCKLPAALAAWLLSASMAVAQHGVQTNVGLPFHQTGSRFFEQVGINFGFHVGNFFFEQNGGAGLPPFGGFNPGAGLNTGFNVHGPGGFNGHFNLVASQGAQTSMVGQSVSTTVPNGVPGAVFDSSLTPFVLGVVPVVGDGGISPLKERLDRLKEGGSAAYGPRDGSKAPSPGTAAPRDAAEPAPAADGAPASGVDGKLPAAGAGSANQPPLGSVSQLQRVRAAADAAQQQETLALVKKGRDAEAAGKPGQARIFYQQAARRAASPLKEQLLTRAKQLGGSPGSAKPKPSAR